jgi:hypothetical protein
LCIPFGAQVVTSGRVTHRGSIQNRRLPTRAATQPTSVTPAGRHIALKNGRQLSLRVTDSKSVLSYIRNGQGHRVYSDTGHQVGYLRVSSLDQNEVRQLEGLALDKTFTDKASGKDAKRPQLEAMQSFVREGDTVFCHSMDRLARNLDDLRRIVLGLTGVPTPNVKNRTLRNLDHSFETAKGRRGLKEPLRRRPAACQV